MRSQMVRLSMAVSGQGADEVGRRRFRRGMLAGAAPHVGIAALVLLSYFTARNHEERAVATMAVLLEVPLAPGALILAVVRAISASTRAWATGLLAGTGVGLLMVLLLVAWHGSAVGLGG